MRTPFTNFGERGTTACSRETFDLIVKRCGCTYRRGSSLDVLRVALALRCRLARQGGHRAAGGIGNVPGARVRRACRRAAPLRDATLEIENGGERGGLVMLVVGLRACSMRR